VARFVGSCQCIGDVLLADRPDHPLGAQDLVKPLFSHELDGTRAVLAHVSEEREGIIRGDPELSGPPPKDFRVFRKKSGQVGGDGSMRMFSLNPGEGERDRLRGIAGLPLRGIHQAQPAARTFANDGNLQPLAGTYAGAARGQKMTVKVTLNGNGLTLAPEGAQRPAPLSWVEGWAFTLGGQIVTFERNGSSGPAAVARLDSGGGHYVLRRQGN
jgi:hypothetical protein